MTTAYEVAFGKKKMPTHTFLLAKHHWQTCSVFPGCCSYCDPMTIMRSEDAVDGVWSKRPKS